MPAVPQHIPLHDGRVDLASAQLHRGGRTLRLSETELRLLRYLVQAEGRVVSRQELQVEVWGASPKARTRAMDSAIARLRTKLEVDPKQPRHLVAVYGQGYRFVPLLEGPRGESALPIERGSFIGRSVELAALSEAFERGARLVSLVGVAGGGKSHLALRFARLRDAARPGRVVLVELEHALDDAAVRAAVGQALSVPAAPGDVENALAAEPGLLLVLDNLERALAPAGAQIQAWLDAAPELLVLATSRAPLHVAGEHLLPVGPMLNLEATQLLLERARALRPDFAQSHADAPHVAALVVALDGLPLAIELAAARARTFTAEGLLQNLDARFLVLVDRRGERSARHASLWQALSRSWALLDAAEQLALMQLSVFDGGFTAAAFSAVLKLPPHLDGPWPVDLLDGLVEASLVEPQAADGRFRMLLSVTAFAKERLTDPSTLPGSTGPQARAEAERRHAAWRASQALQSGPPMESAEESA